LSIGSCFLYAIVFIPALLLYFKPSFIEANLSHSIKKKDKNEKDVIPIISGVGSITAGYAGSIARSRTADGEKS
jgi:predicted RND superfamily exporter protein